MTAAARPFDVVWTVLRVIVAVVCVAAVTAQGLASVQDAAERGDDVPTTIANVFSFFTNLSALLTAAVIVWAVVRFVRRPAEVEPPALATAWAVVTTAMLIVGAVYNTLLRGIPQAALVVWANEALHTVVPLFLAVDLFVGRRGGPLRWRAIGWITAYPAVWLVYTFVRGPLTTDPSGRPSSWYPYPFLNPVTAAGGWSEVALYLAAIAVAVVSVGALVVAVTRLRARRSRRADP